MSRALVLLSASTLLAAVNGLTDTLAYVTFASGTYDAQLCKWSVNSSTSTPLYTFSPGLESAYFTASAAVSPSGVWASSLQLASNETQGVLVEYDLRTNSFTRQVNTLYCWGLFADPASPGNYLCLTDNNMDRPAPPPARGRRAARVARVSAALSAAPSPQTRSPQPPGAPKLTRLCSLYRIVATTGAVQLLGSFPAGEEEDVASAFDAATGVVWALLSDESTYATTLYGLNATSGEVIAAAPFADGSNIIYTLDFDAASASILAMASTFDFSAGQWNTFFASLAVTASQQVELTPIGPLNGTFAAYRQFNDIRAMDSSSGTFYTTVFDYASELFLLGVDAASGALVYEAPVRNPFIDLAVVPL